MHSDLPALLKVSAGRNVSSHAIAEFASIICTDPKRECRTPSAAEIRKVQWKGLLVQRKTYPCGGNAYPCNGKTHLVQWKVGLHRMVSAAESWFSHYRIDCSL